jgi:aldose sugar dehydrogenase
MRRFLVVLLAFAVLQLWSPVVLRALPPGLEVSTYKGNLNFPIDMAWVPGTQRIFFTEKSGKIRIIDNGNLRNRACRTLDVNDDGERGLLGIVLDPNFKSNHRLYVYYANASPLENRVTRFTVENGRCRNQNHIVTGISAASSSYHNGGQLEFIGNKLFVSTGERHDPDLAQARNNRLGKILRYNADGSIPDGNPFSKNGNPTAIWSYGHRNPFGLAHRPGTHRLYETENGPSCDDELNFIKKGRNYGWGSGYSCGTAGEGPNPKPPIHRWSNIVVPTDPWWYEGRINSLSNRLYVGDFGNGNIHRFKLNNKGTQVVQHSIVFNGSAGIVDVSKGPGGWLYFLTENSIRRIHN